MKGVELSFSFPFWHCNPEHVAVIALFGSNSNNDLQSRCEVQGELMFSRKVHRQVYACAQSIETCQYGCAAILPI